MMSFKFFPPKADQPRAENFYIFKKEKGAAMLISVITILFAGLIISASFLFLGLNTVKIIRNMDFSIKSYYVAEAGIEDLILRSKPGGLQMPSSPHTLIVGNGSTVQEYTAVIGGGQTFTSLGNVNNRFRKILTSTISTSEVDFTYGIQVGDLGLQMAGNAIVHGNIFSNGPITGASNTKIYGDAISAGGGGRIEDMKVLSTEGGGSVWANHCEDSNIDGELHYSSKTNCTAGSSYYHDPGDYVEPQDLPISEGQISDWKEAANIGEPLSGYSLGGNSEDSLGPKKINGNMTLDSNVILTLTGTIWVTGNLSFNSNVIVQLDPSYSSLSEAIVVDGKIFVDSNVTLCGSEGYKKKGECNSSAGSYLMLLSTNTSTDPASPAVEGKSNTATAILYASAGLIKISSNAALREATGYGIYMDSNAEVFYESGLADSHFNAGPTGGQDLLWQETY